MATTPTLPSTVNDLIDLLKTQAMATLVERRDGRDPGPWDWIQTALLYQEDRAADVGQALACLLIEDSPCLDHALSQLDRSSMAVLTPIWEQLSSIGTVLLKRQTQTGDQALTRLLSRLQIATTKFPPVEDGVISFLTGIDPSHTAWSLGLILAAGSRPNSESATLANALAQMSDDDLSLLALVVLSAPRRYAKEPLDAIAVLPDLNRKRFGRALEELVQQRRDDRTYLISTTSDPARQQLLRDQDALDIALGIDWDGLKRRLNL